MKTKPPESERQLDLLCPESNRIKWFDLPECTRREIQTFLAQLIAGLVTVNQRHREKT